MTQTPVPKLVFTLAIPTIASMLITSIYNMADTFFVGKIGTSATGAVGISFSLMAIIQAVGFTFGIGSGNFISRLLGAREREKAEKVAATGFFSALTFGAVIAVAGLLLLDPLVRLLGATETIVPYAKSYVRLILLGTPYMTASFVLNNQLRFQGNAFYAMIGIGIGGILNILLDPFFIFVLEMGTAGAALATIISQLISFCLLMRLSREGGGIRIRLKNFTPSWEVYREIFRGGLPSFYRQGFASMATAIMNLCAGRFDDAAIAAMSIVARVFQFALSALLGFGQGFQPVCGFNYGAKRYDRVLEAFWFCMRIAVVVLVTGAVVGYLFSSQIITLFRNDPQVIAVGSRALRWQCVTFPLSAWIVMVNMLLQTINKSAAASLIAMARQGLFFIPIILILSCFAGLSGLVISQPMADVATFLLAIPLGIHVVRELRDQQRAEQPV
ncbi:MAG: MATE family efflux transporter [Anaerotruncus sp.]|nr:MATE family efflux transporter [Anaerotruncus sp.]